MSRNLKLGEIESQTKIKIAKFSGQNSRLFTFVDDQNQIFINKIEYSKSLSELSIQNPFNQQFGLSQNEITSIIFSQSENELVIGSNKGILTYWDISTQKILQNIKGHLSGISCLSIFPNDNNLLISGGMDSQIKIWDSRQQNNGLTLRSHKLQINSMMVSQDGKLLASGSNDGCVKIWEMSTQKQLASFNESDWPICCVQFNPVDKAVAACSDDGCIRYWDVDRLSLISQTIPDKQCIYQIKFCENGQQLFSAQNFSLKAWDMKRDGLLLDYIDSQWKCILDLNVFDNKDIVGLTTQNQTGLSIFGTKMNNINNEKHIYRNHSEKVYGCQINDQCYERHSVNVLKPKNTQIQGYGNILEEQGFQLCNNNSNKFLPTSQVAQRINYESVIQEEDMKQSCLDLIISHDEVNLSSFVIDDSNKQKFKQMDQINEILKDHSKVIQILNQRINYMKPIMHWWSNNNIKSAVNAINQLSEPSILFDALLMCAQSQKFKSIPMEQLPQLLEKCKILIDSKYLSHIKGGLLFCYKTFTTYRDDIQTIKCFNQMSKVDLSREERIAKYDKIVEQLKQIIQMSKLTKLIERNKIEVSDLAKKLQIEMLSLLKRINQL
ncbi:unnamed protein product [Paramecium primaurelia]|uniref:Katanin p80 subunit C-terminal domain-containing protein n=1 Tax=Paramecium primaurelia TaxID=5886 RepID=A0A8S1PAT1_PARPR|nr:unnamed protein product [Paramecium primaurelia]